MAVAGPIIGAVSSIGSGIKSGIQGKQAQQRANQMGEQALGMYRQFAEGNIGTREYLQNQAEQFSNPELGRQLTDNALGLADYLGGIAGTESGNIGQGGFMGDARTALEGAGNFNQYDFSGVGSTREQALDFAQTMGDNARRDARAQMAVANTQANTMLDAQLAQRGLSRDSGAAAVAMSQLGQQNAMNTAQLESALAQQAGQLGLQASQFDISSALQQAQMESGYNLGMNQLTSQTGLAQAQGLMGLQQMSDQQALQRYGMQSEAALQGNAAAQAAYGQNYLQPMMNAQNILGTLASYQGGYAQSGMGQLIGGAQNAAASGGAGIGASLGALGGEGGFINQITSGLESKNQNNQAPATQSILSQIFGKGS